MWNYSLQVEADRREDVLVRRQPLRDHVGVVDDVPTEDQAAANGEDQVHGAAERYEDADEAGHDCGGEVSSGLRCNRAMLTECEQANEQPGSHPGEVVLRRS